MIKLTALKTIFENLKLSHLRLYSAVTTTVLEKTEAPLPSFRTSESSPSNHNTNHVGQFYTVPQDVKKQLFSHGGFPKSLEIQMKTFGEPCVMVRRPALDIINCLKNLDYSKPAVRFVLYGHQGTGKSVTLAHVIHYASENGYIIVHVPWVANWMHRCKEYANSSTREGYVDLPLDAAAWLVHFRSQNADLLSSPELKTSKDYVWTKRESTAKGAPILDLVEHGVNRIKFASDCIVAIADELKILSTKGLCKTLVAVDGYNAFFYPHTRVYTEAKVPVLPEKVTLTQAFLNLTRSDWCNGASVVTVDELAIPAKDHGSIYPYKLLHKDGFEHLDPFVPVRVDGYTREEFEACIQYYRDRLWIQTRTEDIEQQNQELLFLSGQNPYKLMQLCAPL